MTHHYQRTLSPEERAHYAWLGGDYAPEALLEDQCLPVVDSDLFDVLEEYNVETEDDFRAIVRERDDALQELEDLRFDLAEARERITTLEAEQ